MKTPAAPLFIGVAVAVCLWPAVAFAQTQDASGSGPALTVEQVRSSFSVAGFQVEQAHTWDWMSPPVTSLRIRDQASPRLLMVLVYLDPAAARTARLEAEARDETQTSGRKGGADGPHLVDGYGPSAWKANVALVQTTETELDRMFQVQTDRDDCVDTDLLLVQQRGPSTVAVDVDFQQALISTDPSI